MNERCRTSAWPLVKSPVLIPNNKRGTSEVQTETGPASPHGGCRTARLLRQAVLLPIWILMIAALFPALVGDWIDVAILVCIATLSLVFTIFQDDCEAQATAGEDPPSLASDKPCRSPKQHAERSLPC